MTDAADKPHGGFRLLIDRLRRRSRQPAPTVGARDDARDPSQGGDNRWGRGGNSGENSLVRLAGRAAAAGWDEERLQMETHLAVANGLTPQEFASAMATFQQGDVRGATREALQELLLSIGLFSEKIELWREEYGRASLAGLEMAVRSAPSDVRPELATHCFILGNGLYGGKFLIEAEQAFRHGVGLYRALVAAHPEVYRYRAGFADCLTNLANTLGDLSREAEAEACHRESLAMQRLLARSGDPADRSALATSLNNLGTNLSKRGRFLEAEALLMETLGIYRELADHDASVEPDVVMALMNLGQNLAEQRRFDEAEEYLREATQLLRKRRAANRSEQQGATAQDYAEGLAVLSSVLLEQGRFDEAEALLEESVALHPDDVRIRVRLGAAVHKQQRFQEAETIFRRALALLNRTRGSGRETRADHLAMIQDYLGLVLYGQGRYEESEREHQAAVATLRRLSTVGPNEFLPNLADALNNLANPLVAQRRLDDAEQALREGLDIYQQRAKVAGPVYAPDVAIMQLSLGNVLAAAGRVQEGEEAYREAEDLARQLVTEQPAIYRPLLATVLNNLGAMLKGQRRWRDAEAILEEAVVLRRGLVSTSRESYLPLLGTSLTNIGNLRRDLGRFDQAGRDLDEAEEVYRELIAQDRGSYLPDLARTLLNLGSLYHNQHNLSDAERTLRECVSCYRELARPLPAAYGPLLAGGMINLANVLNNAELGPARNPTEAEQLYREALTLDPENLAGARLRALVGMARLARTSDQAYPLYKQALVELEERRSALAHLEDRRALHGEYQYAYNEMIDCCVRLERRGEAWWWAEQARSASLRDLLGSARPRLESAEDVKLYQRWQMLREELFEAEQNYRNGREVSRPGGPEQPLGATPDDVGSWAAAVRTARRREAGLRRQVLGRLDKVRELEHARVPRPWQLTALLRGLTGANLATTVGARPLLVEYQLLDGDQYVVFLVPLWDRAGDPDWAGGELIEAHTIVRPSGALLNILLQFQSAQRSVDQAGRLEDGAMAAWEALPPALGRDLVQPWAGRLLHLHPTELILSANGPLQLLPLHAAEHRSGVPLIEDYPVVWLPNAAMARDLVRRRKVLPRPTGRLVLGPPGTDLRASTIETLRLASAWKLVAPGQTTDRRPFARERMRIDVLRAYPQQLAILHLSTHAQFNPRDYLRSSIVFHKEELTLADVISDARIDLRGCRLCFLNSCQGAQILPDAGDELPGLLWALTYAGAEAVIASLWSVDDGAAAQLAITLYPTWQRPGQTLSAAFQSAVLRLRKQRGNPFYWAPFILAGNAFVEAPPLP